MLFLAPSARSQFTSGRIFSLISSDAQTVQVFAHVLKHCVSQCPLTMLYGTVPVARCALHGMHVTASGAWGQNDHLVTSMAATQLVRWHCWHSACFDDLAGVNACPCGSIGG
jgi:hypothetical protein